VRDPSVPVDDDIAALAQRTLVVVVLLPTGIGLVLGVIAKVIGAIAGVHEGLPFRGLLSWIVMIGVIQLIILAVGRNRYLSGVALEPAGAAEPAQPEPGIFHHEAH